MCPSFEMNARLPVDQYDDVREPGLTFAAVSTAFWIPVAFVTSPLVWKTATSGAFSPVPNVWSVFWFVSYAE